MNFLSRFKKEYFPLNTIEVSKDAIVHNYKYLSSLSSLKIAPVLKSNAYGHDLGSIGKIVDTLGAPFLCVDSIYEGYELLKHNVKTPILIMGYVDPRSLAVKKLPFWYAVSTQEMLDAVHTYQPHAPIHIFVDTGMHREGIPMKQLATFIELLRMKKGLQVEGLLSHFAQSDNHDDVTRLQVKNFQIAQALFKTAGIDLKWIHHANSSAVLNYKHYKGKIGNIARTGIALYGIDPENKDATLQPALTFVSTLSQIKDLAKGATSGYDFTFKAKKDMRIGVVSAGFNDGVDRRLSNTGYMKIGEIYCKIVGRVSMNLTVIDISNVPNPTVGDKVIIFSNVTSDTNSISSVAKRINATAYTAFVQLHQSTKRITG